jgi:hypothetical protein
MIMKYAAKMCFSAEYDIKKLILSSWPHTLTLEAPRSP